MGPSLLLLLFLVGFSAVKADDPYQYDNAETLQNRQTMVHLFEWKWTDIASECENFLQFYGYGAVQVSPPMEHITLYLDNDLPWYVRYQPVSYRLSSRSGNEDQFRDMVNRCNNVGVRIIVDAVMNHMVGVGQKSGQPNVGSSGTSSFNGLDGVESFPAVPYDSDDFHDSICHGDIQPSDYQNNADHVRTCRLVGLLDLNQRSPYVQNMMAGYLNNLISMGVAGFRFDASKHMYPDDLNAILGKLTNLRSDIFGANQRPFAVHEVIDRGGESVQVSEYVTIGRYTNFNYGTIVSQAIWKNRDANTLVQLGPGYQYGNMEDHDVLNFIDNHDDQRDDPPSVITYKDGDQYRLAVSYMLAWPYGYPRVMSSYYFSSHDQGPPNSGASTGYATTSPTFNPDNTCDAKSGWVCEHRWPTIREMAKFRAATIGRAAVEVVTESQRFAFAREGAGFFALNNQNGAWTRTFTTTLPAGDYCDQYNGNLDGSSCTKTKITVGADGTASITIQGNAALAISVVSRIGGEPPAPAPPTGNFQKTVLFLYKDTQLGDNLFIRGGATQGHQCATGPFAQTSDACAIRVIHNSTVPWEYAEYRSWSQGDDYLDFEGEEAKQGTHDGQHATGTPLAYSTNDPNSVDYQPINKYGPNYWFAQLLVDCDKTENGWFELKGFLNNGWEPDVKQGSCGGNVGGTASYTGSPNHLAKCGQVNVFKWGQSDCQINAF